MNIIFVIDMILIPVRSSTLLDTVDIAYSWEKPLRSIYIKYTIAFAWKLVCTSRNLPNLGSFICNHI